MRTRFLLVAILALASCGPAKPMNGPTLNSGKMNDDTTSSDGVVSEDIMSREPTTSHSRVKHILIGWVDLSEAYGGVDQMDVRASHRNRDDAEELVRSLLSQLKAGADFDELLKANSEDPGSLTHPEGYDVTPDAGLVLEFRQLGLRLNVGEIGVCETQFGFHIMKRID
jgi:hypothetical protein